MKRALNAEGNVDHLNFYTLYDGCLMEIAMLNWCKVFGSNSESSHWKTLFPDRVDEIRAALRSSFGGKSEFENAHSEATNYRNKYVSHHSFNDNLRPKKHPCLSGYRRSAHYLYGLIFNELSSSSHDDKLPNPNIKIEEIEKHWAKIIATSRKATDHFGDSLSNK